MPPARIDEARLKQFMGKYVNDMGGAFMMAMLVEPFAGNDLAENSNPVGRLYYAEAGYRRFRRSTETPFNLIFEARK